MTYERVGIPVYKNAKEIVDDAEYLLVCNEVAFQELVGKIKVYSFLLKVVSRLTITMKMFICNSK